MKTFLEALKWKKNLQEIIFLDPRNGNAIFPALFLFEKKHSSTNCFHENANFAIPITTQSFNKNNKKKFYLSLVPGSMSGSLKTPITSFLLRSDRKSREEFSNDSNVQLGKLLWFFLYSPKSFQNLIQIGFQKVISYLGSLISAAILLIRRRTYGKCQFHRGEGGVFVFLFC